MRLAASQIFRTSCLAILYRKRLQCWDVCLQIFWQEGPTLKSFRKFSWRSAEGRGSPTNLPFFGGENCGSDQPDDVVLAPLTWLAPQELCALKPIAYYAKWFVFGVRLLPQRLSRQLVPNRRGVPFATACGEYAPRIEF